MNRGKDQHETASKIASPIGIRFGAMLQAVVMAYIVMHAVTQSDTCSGEHVTFRGMQIAAGGVAAQSPMRAAMFFPG